MLISTENVYLKKQCKTQKFILMLILHTSSASSVGVMSKGKLLWEKTIIIIIITKNKCTVKLIMM